MHAVSRIKALIQYRNNISTHGVIAPHYTDKVVVFDDAGCDAHGDICAQVCACEFAYSFVFFNNPNIKVPCDRII